jgi:hypothetical protein
MLAGYCLYTFGCSSRTLPLPCRVAGYEVPAACELARLRLSYFHNGVHRYRVEHTGPRVEWETKSIRRIHDGVQVHLHQKRVKKDRYQKCC